MTIQKLFLTFLGAGLSPGYPKITGMIAALLTGVLILRTMGEETLFMLVLATSLIGIFEINKYLNALPEEEREGPLAPEIVIDKAAGVWLSLLISYTTTTSLELPYVLELSFLLSLASFALFDSWQPSTIGWLKKNVKGGLGVFGSTVLSGFAGGFLTIVILLGVSKLF